jgi:predicted phosphohydrolase
LKNNHFIFGDVAICGCTGVDINLFCQNEKINNRNITRLENSLKSANAALEPIVFLHFPPIMMVNGQIQTEDEILKLFRKFGVKRCYYGHLHGEDTRFAYTGEFDGVKYNLVSADFVQFMPVLVV